MRSVVVVCVSLIAAGVGLFLYKVLVLGYPLTAADAPGTWRVEQVINVTGQRGRVVVEVPLPRSSSYQQLLTEEVRSGLLRFAIDEDGSGRHGRWSGKLDGSTSLSYEVTFTTVPVERSIPASETRPTYPKNVKPFLEETPGIQSNDPAIAELSRELALDGDDRALLAQAIFEFVTREIGSLRTTGAMDALSVVREGRGNALGRARLFCALSRANGLPCRVLTGIVLRTKRQEALRYWNEAYIGATWVPFDVVDRLAGKFPANRLVLSSSEQTAVEATGSTALSYRFYVQSESETYTDLVRRRMTDSPQPIDRFSLLLLPVQVQQSLRFLLLVPLGVLAMCVLRNIVGVSTFGMFMPMLLALALTTTGLLWGTIFLIGIVSFALLSRLWIQRFYLLLAPRIAFILTMVVLLMVAAMMIGNKIGVPASGVGAFPFVIMTMIVERISVGLEEEGFRNTVRRVGATLFSIYATYAVIQATLLQTLFLIYPEILLVILGLLIIVGRYTGYRLTELLRFRTLLAGQRPASARLDQDAA